MQAATHKAIFLDRDGTLIVDKHYLFDPNDVELIAGVGAALARARELGYALFLFSNQSGVGRGYFSLEDVHACNERMIELMGFKKSPFVETCLAVERPDEPQVYRKPSPRFIDEMVAKYRLEVKQCYMVGDKEADWKAGIAGNVHPIAVQTGKPFTAEHRAFFVRHEVDLYRDVGAFVDGFGVGP